MPHRAPSLIYSAAAPKENFQHLKKKILKKEVKNDQTESQEK